MITVFVVWLVLLLVLPYWVAALVAIGLLVAADLVPAKTAGFVALIALFMPGPIVALLLLAGCIGVAAGLEDPGVLQEVQ